MSTTKQTQEEKILGMVKKVLTDVAKDTFVRPGIKHPLSENTILGIRDCLSLITAREMELAKEQGRDMNKRPRFIDEPNQNVVVPLTNFKSEKQD
ncbi:MAG: segregation and condensation protein A [Gammaproteobacteria bacterium]|nr:segregation and condensation protein A [Gammaproteobacteria bacterium]MDH5777133.1 segregation and condensation protein A [Gammaproteobacteria bacterium]